MDTYYSYPQFTRQYVAKVSSNSSSKEHGYSLQYDNSILSIMNTNNFGNGDVNFSFYIDKKYINTTIIGEPYKINSYIMIVKDTIKIFFVQQNKLYSINLDNNFHKIPDSDITIKYDTNNIFNINKIIYNNHTNELIIHSDGNKLSYLNENESCKTHKYKLACYEDITPIRFTNLLYSFHRINGCLFMIDDKYYEYLITLYNPGKIIKSSLTTDYYNNVLYAYYNNYNCYNNKHFIRIFNHMYDKSQCIELPDHINSNLISTENELIYVNSLNNIKFMSFNGRYD